MALTREQQQQEEERRRREDAQHKAANYRASWDQAHGLRVKWTQMGDDPDADHTADREVAFAMGLPPGTQTNFKPGVLKRDGYEDIYFHNRWDRDTQTSIPTFTYSPGDRDTTNPKPLSEAISNIQMAAASQGHGTVTIHLTKPNLTSTKAMLAAYERAENMKPPMAMYIDEDTRAKLLEHYGDQKEVKMLFVAEQKSKERYERYMGRVNEKHDSKARAENYHNAAVKMQSGNNAAYSSELRSGDVNQLFNSIPADATGQKPMDARLAKLNDTHDMISTRMEEMDKAIKELESEITKREKTLTDLEGKAARNEAFDPVLDQPKAKGVKIANDNEFESRAELLEAMKTEMKELQRLRNAVRAEINDNTKGYPASPAVGAAPANQQEATAGKIRSNLDKWDREYPGDDASVNKKTGDIQGRYLAADNRAASLLQQMPQQQQSPQSRRPV